MSQESKKITALYERLSKDDLLVGESMSIQIQKEMLEKYAKDNGFTNIRHFSDDGTSGTVFNRPGLNAMLEEVKAGNVAVVIFKDQSRIGRDVLEVGLLKRTFEENNVRYIAANDGLDSAKGFNIMSIFRDVFNEFYVADTSMKIRAAKRVCALQGRIGRRPPYGYLFGKDKREWVVDEHAAEIVREIFRRFVSGDSPTEIGRDFYRRKVLTPVHYFRKKDSGDNITVQDREIIWNISSITIILDNPVYIGTFTAQKSTTPSYKIRKEVIRPEEEWVVIKEHHPAIVDVETFEIARRLRANRRRPTKRGEVGILSGLAFCADCRSVMSLSNSNLYSHYVCSKYRNYKGVFNERGCTRHTITRAELEAIALAKIQETIEFAITDKEKFAEAVYRSTNKEAERTLKTKSAELLKAETRIEELDRIISRTYEDHVLERVSSERFTKILAGFESEQAKLKESTEILKTETEDLKSKAANLDSFYELVSRFSEITELTSEIARTFIERVEVHEPIYRNGNKRDKENQDVHVYMTFLGNLL